jgi:hypothetical protein
LTKKLSEDMFKATFENGGFWEYYKDLERQFETFLEYVPYLGGNENTYSFRLANLILAIGAHIDSAFKEMARYPEFSGKCPTLFEKVSTGKRVDIRDYLDLAVEYKLPQKKVLFKCLPERVSVTPFQHYKKTGTRLTTPNWWRIYNGVKHKFKKNFHKANLQNTRNALAGAFLLNVIHKPAILRFNDYGILKWPSQPLEGVDAEIYEHSLIRMPREALEDMLKRNQSLWCFVETPLFVYDYDQDEEDNSD